MLVDLVMIRPSKLVPMENRGHFIAWKAFDSKTACVYVYCEIDQNKTSLCVEK